MSFQDVLDNENLQEKQLLIQEEENQKKDKIFTKKKEKENLNNISDELDCLMEIQKEINYMVYQQDVKFDNITQQIENTNNNIETAKNDIKESHKIYWKVAGPVSAGIIGGVVAGPIGFYAGLKGAMLASASAGAGLVTGVGTKLYNSNLRKK